MKYPITIAAFALSTFAVSALAQQPSDHRPDNSLRVAQTKPPNPCPSVPLVLPKRKDAQAELSNALPKDYKWDKDCVARIVGTFNLALEKEEQKLKATKCDSGLTRAKVEQDVADYTKHYDIAVKLECRHPLKP